MKLSCDKAVLADAISRVSGAVANRADAQPALAGIRVHVKGGRAQLAATNLDLTLIDVVTIDEGTDGVAVIPARLLGDIVRSLAPGSVTIDAADGEEAKILGGKASFSLQTLPAESFPNLPTMPSTKVTLPAADLCGALAQIIPSASKDAARPILTGVLFAAEGSGLRMVATDSYRLAVRDLPGTTLVEDGASVIVPANALNLVMKLAQRAGEVAVAFGKREVSFEVGQTRLTSRLIEGEYPNYRQIVPTNLPTRVVANRDELLDTLRRVKLIAPDQPLKMTLDAADTAMFQAGMAGVGAAVEDLDVKFEGTPMSISFNPEYLVAGIEAVDGDEVSIEVSDPLKPGLVTGYGTNDGFSYVVMPLRATA